MWSRDPHGNYRSRDSSNVITWCTRRVRDNWRGHNNFILACMAMASLAGPDESSGPARLGNGRHEAGGRGDGEASQASVWWALAPWNVLFTANGSLVFSPTPALQSDAIDNGQNKKVLQLVEKILKKNPSMHCAKVFDRTADLALFYYSYFFLLGFESYCSSPVGQRGGGRGTGEQDHTD